MKGFDSTLSEPAQHSLHFQRKEEPSSVGCLDLAECVRNNRKTLAPNQKQLSAEVRRRDGVRSIRTY
jgi:hypothetical protein